MPFNKIPWNLRTQRFRLKKSYLKFENIRYMVPASSCWYIEAETKWPSFSRRHFQMHLICENVWIPIEISLKCVPKGPIDIIPALVQLMAWRLVQIMAWRRPGDKPLYEPMMVSLQALICVTRPYCVNTSGGPVGWSHEACLVHVISCDWNTSACVNSNN